MGLRKESAKDDSEPGKSSEKMRNQNSDKLIIISLSRVRGSPHHPNKKVWGVTGKIHSGSIWILILVYLGK